MGSDDAREGHQEGPESASEQRASTIVAACFMVLVGLSMPMIFDHGTAEGGGVDGYDLTEAGQDIGLYPSPTDPEGEAADSLLSGLPPMDAGQIAWHVLIVTLISNLGKMFPVFCYRRAAHWRERLALSIGMWPRGEVGAGVLVVSLSYGIGGPVVTVAVLSLALNLLLTGLFIAVVKRLIAPLDLKVSAS